MSAQQGRVTVAIAVAALLVAVAPPVAAAPSGAPGPPSLVPSQDSAPTAARLAGDDRVATAVAVSAATFPHGTDHVVLATGGQYPDALAGAALAGAVGGPVLLTRARELEAQVRDEITRLGPATVTVLGSTAAIPAAVDATLADLGVAVERVAGSDRFDTAGQVAARVRAAVGDAGRAYVVEGQHADPRRGWPDATAVAALAAHERAPVLLTRHGHLPTASVDALSSLGPDEIIVVGGDAAVSPAVARRLEEFAGTVTRVAGGDRWATSAAVGDRSRAAGLDATRPWVVTGGEWADALAAGPAAAHRGSATVLVAGDDLDRSPATQRWLYDADVRTVTAVGGPRAIGHTTLGDLGALAAGRGAEAIHVSAAGDIACDPAWDWSAPDRCRHADTAALAEAADYVVALGDLQYHDATMANLLASYDPTWGRFKSRTLPVPGNHEYYVDGAYHPDGARDYFDYFGEGFGQPFAGYYERDLGDWQLLAIDSNCRAGVDCEPDGAQARWLAERLAASDRPCTLAFMHHPAHGSSPRHGSDPYVEPLVDVLANAGVDVLLTAHAHKYERLRRADARGNVDVAGGMRMFVVGTGGVNLHPLGSPRHQLHVTGTDEQFGVLDLELHATGYRWAFNAVEDPAITEREFSDAGFGSCR